MRAMRVVIGVLRITASYVPSAATQDVAITSPRKSGKVVVDKR